MIYKVTCEGELLYKTGDPTAFVVDPLLTLSANEAGTLSFTMDASHPLYGALEHKVSRIGVYRDEELIWQGRPESCSRDFYMMDTWTCEGDLAILSDTVQPQAEYHDMSVRGMLQTVIDIHNAKSSQHFAVGMVTVTDPNDSLYRYSNFETTLDFIRDKLIDRLGGYLRIRYVNGIRYLDYLAESPKTSNQVIEFGTNLMDFVTDTDNVDLCTVVIPLGAKIDDALQPDAATIQALEKYVDITSVNGGLSYLVNQEALERFGWIEKVVHFNDVHIPAILKTKGLQYLQETQFSNVILKVSAVDMHILNPDIQSLDILDQVLVSSPPHGLRKMFPVSERSIPLDDPGAEVITLGLESQVTLTAITSHQNSELIDRLDRIPARCDIMQEAIDNATEILNAGTHGYNVYEPNEFLAMDTYSKDTATKLWRINLGGMGFSSTGYEGPYKYAFTMDGSFNTEFITVGSIHAHHIDVVYTQAQDKKWQDELDNNYWDAQTTESKIANTADAINLSVTQQITDTRQYADNLKSAADSHAETVAATAEANAKADTVTKLGSYYTKSEIDIKKDAIDLAISDQGAALISYADGIGSAANTYADSVGEAAQSHADDVASTAEANAKADTVTKLGSYYTKSEIDIQRNAINLAVTEAISTSEGYADSIGTTLQAYADDIGTAAQAYADGVAALAETNAKADTATKLTSYYTKSQIDLQRNAINLSVTEAITTSQTYADEAAATAEANAKADTTTRLTSYYTKSEIDIQRTAINLAVETAGTNANAYADSIGTSLRSYADGIGEAAQAYADDIGTAANTYADETAATAEANAKADTTSKLTAYYTKSEIDLQRNAINLAVEEAVTTSQAYSDEVGTAANTYADGVGTAANTYADQVGNSAKSAANAYTDSKLTGYYAKSDFSMTPSSIIASLTTANGNISAIQNDYVKSADIANFITADDIPSQDMSGYVTWSQVGITPGSTYSIVTTNGLGTLIQQTSSDVIVAWNAGSNEIKLTNGLILLKDGTTTRGKLHKNGLSVNQAGSFMRVNSSDHGGSILGIVMGSDTKALAFMKGSSTSGESGDAESKLEYPLVTYSKTIGLRPHAESFAKDKWHFTADVNMHRFAIKEAAGCQFDAPFTVTKVEESINTAVTRTNLFKIADTGITVSTSLTSGGAMTLNGQVTLNNSLVMGSGSGSNITGQLIKCAGLSNCFLSTDLNGGAKTIYNATIKGNGYKTERSSTEYTGYTASSGGTCYLMIDWDDYTSNGRKYVTNASYITCRIINGLICT